MLKINKILSKKIKSPLSLREEERRSNLSGFSLIELMVAIAILAMAIFGIFHAYSAGFMGMADARDRTVATNYLQEMIEDFKNMDFNQVKSEPITPLPDTKFSRGAYVLNLEVIDEVVTLKKVIAQVRWIDRKGNIKTEKASTILYKKPATSEVGDNAIEIVLYALSYYTILPENTINLIAGIKDENGNIYDWDGPINFSVITEPPNVPQVGNITTSQPVPATHGVANCIFTASVGDDVEGIERIQAAATVEGKDLSDTVNIRVSTGPVGIVIVPASEEDRVLAAGIGVSSNIKLYVVKADYDYNNNPVAYESPITLSADGPGTLSTTTVSSVDTEGFNFTLESDGSPGIVEITASAPDLDMGYTEITFTGEPDSILVTPEKKSIYPGEEINITVTIVDVNKVPVEFSGTVTLKALIDGELTAYGILDGTSNSISLDFTDENFRYSTFKATLDSPVGETITIQANAGDLSGSIDITILSSLTPKYLELFTYPLNVDIYGEEIFTSITATIYDDSGTEKVITYETPIFFVAKDKYGNDFNGSFSANNVIPSKGEVTVKFFSVDNSTGTATITASSSDLILNPVGGIDVVFYGSATQIVLSADPPIIQVGGDETSIITATVCDEGGNEVANYNINGDKFITFTTSIGGFPDNENKNTITTGDFDEGEVLVALSSTASGTAEVTASSIDDPSVEDGSVLIYITGEIPTVLTLGDVTNWDDYIISFDIIISGSALHLDKMQIEWDNINATLDEVEMNSYSIASGSFSSIHIIEDMEKVLFIGEHDIIFTFSGSKMKQKIITVTFIDNNDPPNEYEVSFKVPN